MATVKTTHVPEKHTKENRAGKLQAVMDDWGLLGRISTCVHDNAANIKAAGRLCNLCDEWEDWCCAAHTLQLAVNAGLQVTRVSNVVARLSGLVPQPL